MSTYEHTVIVERPVGVVYNQWTQFETYPDFMDDVELVQQSTETMTHWKVRVRGVPREYDAAITYLHQAETDQTHAAAALKTMNGETKKIRASDKATSDQLAAVTQRINASTTCSSN